MTNPLDTLQHQHSLLTGLFIAMRLCIENLDASDEALALRALVDSATGMVEDADEYVAELRKAMKPAG